MHRYQVIDRNLEDRAIAFVDATQHYHVARSQAEMPGVGDLLEGMAPALGPALLTSRHGQVFRLIFDLVHVTQVDAFERLHASLTP